MKWLIVLMFVLGACGSSQVRSTPLPERRGPSFMVAQTLEEGSPEEIEKLEAQAELLVLKRDVADTQLEVLRTQHELRQVKADFLQLQQKFVKPTPGSKKKGASAIKFAWNP